MTKKIEANNKIHEHSNKSDMTCIFQDQMQMRIVCPGRVSAIATSPGALYCVAAIEEKIHVWQVHLGFFVNFPSANRGSGTPQFEEEFLGCIQFPTTNHVLNSWSPSISLQKFA